MSEELKWALAEFGPKSARLKDYAQFGRYYDGDQPLAFATSKYRNQFWRLFKGFCDNMCQSVVDVQAERLEIIGFTSSAAEVKTLTLDHEGNEIPEGSTAPTVPNPMDAAGPDMPGKTTTITLVDDGIGEQAWDEWEQESMDLVADEVHSDVFKYGDAFVIADEEGIWRQEPSEMAVRYSRERPGVIEVAAKMWLDSDKHARLNIYEQTGLTKFRSADKVKKVSDVKEVDMVAMTGDDEGGPLPQGIPVIHFANKAYGRYGISELAPVLPLQDALNKAEMDLILSMEYQAFRQRWVAGVDVELDEEGKPKGFLGEHGPGKYLAFPDADVKTGEFSAAELKPYVDVIENLRAQIARVSGIPPYYFFVGSTGATISGETLKTSETRFTRKGKRQQRCLGKSWESLMDLVLEITSSVVDEAEYDDEADLNTVWEEPTNRSESEEMDVLTKKSGIGVPNSQLQKEAGYDDDEIERFAIEFAANVKAGLQAAPGKNAENQIVVAKGQGDSTASAASGVSGKGGTTPVSD